MLRFSGGFRDEPASEIKFAPYGSSLEMDCRIDLEPPIQFHWKKLGGLLPSDTQILEVCKTHILPNMCLYKNIFGENLKKLHMTGICIFLKRYHIKIFK